MARFRVVNALLILRLKLAHQRDAHGTTPTAVASQLVRLQQVLTIAPCQDVLGRGQYAHQQLAQNFS